MVMNRRGQYRSNSSRTSEAQQADLLLLDPDCTNRMVETPPADLFVRSPTTIDQRAVSSIKALSVDRVAALLGVSTATVRNWVRAGHLKPVCERPLSFLEQDAVGLKAAIALGSLDRLRKRANKSGSETMGIPKEYAASSRLVAIVDRILSIADQKQLDVNALMFVSALRWLELHGEVERTAPTSLFAMSTFDSWKRESVRAEILTWHCTLRHHHSEVYEAIYSSMNDVVADDILGLIYQSLSNEGAKSKKGSYYTPPNVVIDALTHTAFYGQTFLDPCCGTGQYLLCAARLLNLSPENIFGFDLDELATRIARLNLLVAFPSHDFQPNISCLNALTELATEQMYCNTNHLLGQIDFIATNPPWGSYKNSPYSASFTNGINSNEAFALFLAKSLTLLKQGGRLSFILPESILRIRTHADIRELLLNNTKLTHIAKLGRLFTGVFTPAIRLDLIKGKADRDWSVSIAENGSRRYEIPQQRFMTNHHYAFNVGVTDSEDQIIKKLYAIDHLTLENNADWALGIITGDNARFISDTPGVGMEPVFRGSDISTFGVGVPRRFVKFEPAQFQQVAREELYRAPEKLIYRFITDTLTFAYDDKQRLTLNSANVVIPRLPGFSMKAALAFLNSRVFQYIFTKTYSTHKVLRGDLEKLPFPIAAADMSAQIEALVDACQDHAARRAQLDELVYAVFGLTPSEKHEIERTTESK